MVVNSSVDYKLNVMGPSGSGIRHLNLLPVVMVVRNGSIEHTEPLWCGEVSSYHTDVYFSFTWLGIGSRRRSRIDRDQWEFSGDWGSVE